MGARPSVVVFERLEPSSTVPLPRRATRGSAGFDLAASVEVRLVRGRVVRVPTGLKARSPAGTFLEVRPRSGLGSKGVLMVNAPGTIDRDYSGEIQVPLTYLFDGEYRIRAGDRIAQLRLVPDLRPTFRFGRVGSAVSRSGGFGSTGR